MSANAARGTGHDEVEWQRLDLWLWCARVAKGRADCARLVEAGGIRLNRQPVVKAHAKLRVGDVLTMVLRDEVRVWRIRMLAARRGPAAEARLLYEDVPEAPGADPGKAEPNPCAKPGPAAYRAADAAPDDDEAPVQERGQGA